MSREAQIREIRLKSLGSPGSYTLILEDVTRREFFRYEEGELVEYDLTKCYGRHITLRRIEQDSLRKGEWKS